MDSVFPQLLRLSDVALPCLCFLEAAIFFEGGRRHASDPSRQFEIEFLDPGVEVFAFTCLPQRHP